MKRIATWLLTTHGIEDILGRVLFVVNLPRLYQFPADPVLLRKQSELKERKGVP